MLELGFLIIQVLIHVHQSFSNKVFYRCPIVLMAADILLYQADLVPVGEDQRQHLELTRDICRRFNDQFCKKNRKTFKEPNALIVKEGARVMSLTDGTSKMSKSAEVDYSRINLLDTPDIIAKKFKKCKTDLAVGLEWDNSDRPECINLLTIYQAVTDKSKEEILAEVGSMSWGSFKPILGDAVIAHLEPIQKRYAEIRADQTYLDGVLKQGQESAEATANLTLKWAKDAMGFHPPSV
jgi:tryptophanyl-tRNA synthetase